MNFFDPNAMPADAGRDRFDGGDQASRLRDLFRTRPREIQDLVSSAAGVQPSRRRTPIFAITSGKGGVGKTNLAVGLCTALAPSHGVTLLDADLGMANADVLCGVSVHRRLHHALPAPDGPIHGRVGAHASGDADLASLRVPTPLGFSLVPGSVGVSRITQLAPAEQRSLLRGLVAIEARSDAIFIDTGAGISPGVFAFLDVADVVLVVATPEPTSIADAYALIKCYSSQPRQGSTHGATAARLRLVVNQAADTEQGQVVHGRIAKVCREFLKLDLPLAGVIHKDPRLVDAVMSRTSVVSASPSSPAAGQIRQLAQSLAREWLTAPAAAVPERETPLTSRLAAWRRAFGRGRAG
ncbi:MAG: P-loop NTPase [Phycisphaerales bacterium]|nr:P-loop NTPase [Phycisphaerales bacterium]